MKHQQIFDVDGNVLYEGKARNKKAFARYLIKEGYGMANADLKGVDLSRMDLTRKDFSNANLDGADLRGSTLDKAYFRGASLLGVRASGISAKETDFSNSKLGEIEIHGTKYRSSIRDSILTSSKWDGADISHTSFEGSSLTSSTFAGSTIWGTDFKKCRLHNADWVESSVTSCDFTDADLTPTMSLGHKHLPDRTLRAKIYGNTFKDTEIGVGNAQFKADLIWNKITKYKIWAAGTVVATLALDYATAGGITGLNLLSSMTGLNAAAALPSFNQGALIIGAGILVKSTIEEVVTNLYTSVHAQANLQLRHHITETVSKGINLGSLAVLIAKPSTNRIIAKYMKLSKDSIFKKVCETVNGDLEIILCSRKSLARALAKMCDTMINRVPLDRKVVLARIEDENDNGPKIFAINTDGTTEAVWSHSEHGDVLIKWDAEGKRIQGTPNENLIHSGSDRNTAIDFFMKKIILDHNLPEFNFNSKTHAVRAGKDGSAVVVNRAKGTLQNSKGPVVLTPNDEAIYPTFDKTKLKNRIEEMKSSLGVHDQKPFVSEMKSNDLDEEKENEVKMRVF